MVVTTTPTNVMDEIEGRGVWLFVNEGNHDVYVSRTVTDCNLSGTLRIVLEPGSGVEIDGAGGGAGALWIASASGTGKIGMLRTVG